MLIIRFVIFGLLSTASFASGICAVDTLASLNGTTVQCGTVTFDFIDLSFENGITGFGPDASPTGNGSGAMLGASQILVTMYGGPEINFSVIGGAWVADNAESGASTYRIIFDIDSTIPFSSLETNAYGIVINTAGGQLALNPEVLYGAYDIGAGINVNVSPGPFFSGFETSGPSDLPEPPYSVEVYNQLDLLPFTTEDGTGRVEMQSFENVLVTPEPGTWELVLGFLALFVTVKRLHE